MKLLAYGVLSSATVIAAAGAIAPSTGITSQAIQGGASVILGSIIWYLLTKTFPAHAADLRDQREAFLKAMNAKCTVTQDLISAITRKERESSEE